MADSHKKHQFVRILPLKQGDANCNVKDHLATAVIFAALAALSGIAAWSGAGAGNWAIMAITGMIALAFVAFMLLCLEAARQHVASDLS